MVTLEVLRQMILAAEKGQDPLQEFLKKQEIEIDACLKNANSETALILAIQAKNLPAVKCLIQAGADPKQKNEHFGTPLHYAAEKGFTEIIPILVAAGSDINAHFNSRSHDTPFMWASYNKQISSMKALLDCKADVESIDQRCGGWTELFKATVRGSDEVVTLLLSAGAKLNARDNFNFTPLTMVDDMMEQDKAGSTHYRYCSKSLQKTRELLKKAALFEYSEDTEVLHDSKNSLTVKVS